MLQKPNSKTLNISTGLKSSGIHFVKICTIIYFEIYIIRLICVL